MSRAAIRTSILILLLLVILAVLFFLLRPSPTQQTATTTSESTSAQPQKTVDVAVNEGTMTPGQITVDEGNRVTLNVTSDSPLQLHIHGYDIEKDIEPNEPTEIPFDATITGRFEIEDHNTDVTLGELLVQPR